nr:MAG TPA: hypothetical protein [Caudoviricetes sp.]
MQLFWSFWVPLNFLFWWCAALKVNNPGWKHVAAGTVFAAVTGLAPFLIYQAIK